MRLPPYFKAIGRRGAYLLSKGILYLLFGCGLAVSVQNPPSYYAVLQQVAPMQVWGLVWILVGLTSISAAFIPEWRTKRLTPIAFAGLMAMATVWAVGVLAVYLTPEFIVIGTHPWIVSAIFASLMASTAIVAGWPDAGRRE